MNLCYKCKHRKKLQGDAHTKCGYPDAIMKPIEIGEKLNIKGNAHGINNGWFNWPFNFDPLWLECCEGYEEKENEF